MHLLADPSGQSEADPSLVPACVPTCMPLRSVAISESRGVTISSDAGPCRPATPSCPALLRVCVASSTMASPTAPTLATLPTPTAAAASSALIADSSADHAYVHTAHHKQKSNGRGSCCHYQGCPGPLGQESMLMLLCCMLRCWMLPAVCCAVRCCGPMLENGVPWWESPMVGKCCLLCC